jgi:hypothetical protein
LDLDAADLRPSTDPFLTFDAVRAALHKIRLRLESSKGPGEFLVIDRLERPSEN